MSQAPSMPMFVDAMLADTMHLTTEEFGAYHFILYATWRNNGRPLDDDAAMLARVCRVTPNTWKKLRPILVRFFDVSDGTWRQKRLEREWSYVTARAERAKANGKAGGRPKRTQDKPGENPAGYLRDTQDVSSQSHTQEEDIRGTRDGRSPVRPVDVITAFDGVLHDVFGPDQSRLNPNASDHVFAQRFLESGADLELIVGTIRPIVQRFKAEGQRAPSNLKMFEPWIAGAVQALSAPPAEARHVNGTRPSGKPARRTAGDALEELDRLRARVPVAEPGGSAAEGIIIDQAPACH